MSRRTASILFALLLIAFCFWVLSLPLFPTQDGPMHKYYVHVLASLLSGSSDYSAYVIRHPFPPYATHYAVLLGLSRIVSLDMAEKLLVCLIFVCTAYGVRFCAKSLGPGGEWISLCVVPLVLHWSLVMGFLNYSLGLGLFFFAAGVWCRAARDARLWWVFGLLSVLLMLTHPVPLLLLIGFCSLDLLIRFWQKPSRTEYVWQFAGLAIAGICFLYPLASVDRQRSAANLHGFGLHKDALVSSLALFGVSPFDTRARSLWINGYRLAVCALLAACFVLAVEGVASRWRKRQLRPADSMLILSGLLLPAVVVLPAAMNGSDFFSQRLLIVPWFGAVAAASATRRRLTTMAPAFAVLLTLLTLVPAEVFVRPVAQQLVELEHQSLPRHAEGLAMLDPGMLQAVRRQHQLGFNPYLWSGALPFLQHDDVMLNSPFMDQKITPLMPAARSGLFIERMQSPDQAERLINGNLDLPAMPPELRSELLASTRVIVLVGHPRDGDQGLAPFACSDHAWYLMCLRSD
jgi:hypothetical protein